MSERTEGVDGGAMYAGGVRIHGGGKRRSSLDAGMASRTLTIMTRWHESMRSCAVRCSNALLHGDLSSAARSTAGDCCSSSGLVRATYTHFSNAVRYFGSRLLPCSVVHAGRRVSSVRAYILKWEVK